MVNQLERLSNLRKLQPVTVKYLEAMPLTIEDVIGKIENDRLYKKGLEKGLEKGIEKGIEEGLEKGKQIAARNFVVALLKDGRYQPEEIASLSGFAIEFVLEIKKELEHPTPPSAFVKKHTRQPAKRSGSKNKKG